MKSFYEYIFNENDDTHRYLMKDSAINIMNGERSRTRKLLQTNLMLNEILNSIKNDYEFKDLKNNSEEILNTALKRINLEIQMLATRFPTVEV